MKPTRIAYLWWIVIVASILGMCAAGCSDARAGGAVGQVGGAPPPGDGPPSAGGIAAPDAGATPPDAGAAPRDAGAPPPDAATPGPVAGPGQRTFTFVNRCSETVWVGALGNGGRPAPNGGGWRLDPGASNRLAIDDGWGGRFWGRRGCHFDDNGLGTCATGDCGGKLACNGAGGAPPTSLAELTLDGTGNLDFYDLSLVDGFDLPLQIAPSSGARPDDPRRCGTATCAVDIVARCPAALQKRDGAGRVVACLSACAAFGTDQYCCSGAFGPGVCNPDTWGANDSAALFKSACPDAYSYAYDDTSSTYTCGDPRPDYTITFCPKEPS